VGWGGLRLRRRRVGVAKRGRKRNGSQQKQKTAEGGLDCGRRKSAVEMVTMLAEQMPKVAIAMVNIIVIIISSIILSLRPHQQPVVVLW
jgi:hypothetical protein